MIRYTSSLEDVTAERLTGFWVGWPDRPSPEAHLAMLAGSEAFVLAVDDDDGGRVVGFANAVGDGVLAAYIPCLEVLPGHQGRGIGSELVRRLLDRLSDRYMVDLVCDEDVMPFYERLGLLRHGAMILRRRGAVAEANRRLAGEPGRTVPAAGGPETDR